MMIWGKFQFPIERGSSKVFKDFLEELDRRKERNSCNFPQACDTLITGGHWELEFLESPCYHILLQANNSSPEPPPYITRPVRERYLELDKELSTVGTEISLTRRLFPVFPGTSSWRSQIWRARVAGREVLAKVYQACFLPDRPEVIGVPGVLIGFDPEEERAHREAWAYSQLYCLQGTVIPHSYGFFKESVDLCFGNADTMLKSPPCRSNFPPGIWHACI
jgi:hypothetical protein